VSEPCSTSTCYKVGCTHMHCTQVYSCIANIWNNTYYVCIFIMRWWEGPDGDGTQCEGGVRLNSVRVRVC
jgi:hypothetical protein